MLGGLGLILSCRRNFGVCFDGRCVDGERGGSGLRLLGRPTTPPAPLWPISDAAKKEQVIQLQIHPVAE